MAALPVQIRTISPIFIPLDLQTGVNRNSPKYTAFEKQLYAQFSSRLISKNLTKATEYESITSDSWQQQLFTWQNNDLAPNLFIHVFANNIAIVVIDHSFDEHNLDEQDFVEQGSAQALEQLAQQQAKAAIEQIYADFVQSLADICLLPHANIFSLQSDVSQQPHIFWVSRTILLSAEQTQESKNKQLIKQWLAHTYRPEDAQDIINQDKSYSMTWLNYVIVDFDNSADERLDAMILAQYYYAAQENCNKHLKQAIDGAYNDVKNTQAQKLLSKSRVNSRLHQVNYHEHLQYLTRSKRKVLENILHCWNYPQLIENGQRMIDICSSKIEETENIKRERSSLMTDLLLVALSFFAIFELSLYLSELSREMMSRPTLDFNDDSRSFVLKFIAEIDMDVMFGSGFFLTLLLVFIYKFIKSR